MFRDIKLFFQIFLIIFIILFFIFNGSAFLSFMSYKSHKLAEAIQGELLRSPSFLSLGGFKISGLFQQLTRSEIILPPIPPEAETSNILELPQFAIKAPILEVAKLDLSLIYEKLKQGVVLYPGSAVPGQGHSIIIGHSSQYPWEAGRYKSVFSLLNQLEPGDKIYVFWEQLPLVFEVKEKKIFLPWPKGLETTETIFSPSDEPTIILQSCWPVGVASKRVAVKTVLVR